MRALGWSALVVLAFLAGATTDAAAHCAPPCGPIPVVLEVKTGGPKYVAFGDKPLLTFDGTVSFYVNVDQDGFWFDPQQPPEITFRINRQPPWLKTKVEPDRLTVPISDPQYVKNEGSPDQVEYYWEAPIKITITKLRDPTVDEVSDTSSFIRGDGSYRDTLSAQSSSSIVAPGVFGPNMGLQEGYGVKEFRFTPEIDGVQWKRGDDGVLAPVDGNLPKNAKGTSSAPSVAPALLAALVAVALRRPE